MTADDASKPGAGKPQVKRTKPQKAIPPPPPGMTFERLIKKALHTPPPPRSPNVGKRPAK